MKNGYYNSFKTMGAFSMALDSSIFKEYLELLKQMHTITDMCIFKLQEKYKNECFTCYPNLMCCDLTHSQTTRGRVQVKFMKKLKWDILQYHLNDTNIIHTIPGKNYIVRILINSHLPKFKIILYSIPTVIKIDQDNITRFIKQQSVNKIKILESELELEIKFEAMSNVTILKFYNIFINDYNITSNEKIKQIKQYTPHKQHKLYIQYEQYKQQKQDKQRNKQYKRHTIFVKKSPIRYIK